MYWIQWEEFEVPSRRYLRCLRRGLKSVSREKPIITNASETRAIEIPGGSTHHQICWAPFSSTRLSILPHDKTDTSPNPRKLRAASVRIAPGTANARLT